MPFNEVLTSSMPLHGGKKCGKCKMHKGKGLLSMLMGGKKKVLKVKKGKGLLSFLM